MQSPAPLTRADSAPAHKILLVEDYPANILVTTTLLEMMGRSYEVAQTGEEAIEKVKKTAFKCILMDLKMPGIDGLHATRLIRAWEAEQGLPPMAIIGMTACALVGDKEECFAAGMDAYISKPFKQEELEQKLIAFHC